MLATRGDRFTLAVSVPQLLHLVFVDRNLKAAAIRAHFRKVKKSGEEKGNLS
jgi:hypothetical protein